MNDQPTATDAEPTETEAEPTATERTRPWSPAATSRRVPGLLRTLVHRLGGDDETLPVEGRLPSLSGATGWLNAEPLTPEGLVGRVVLVDFWTYTCVNWLRTLPYLRAWDEKYRGHGLAIIGVHTPEFGFERDLANVTAHVRDFGIEYPVAIDSDYGVWRAFENHFWPALYLADAEGQIRFHHFGEGEYAMTEMAIQQLLLAGGAEEVDPDLVAVEPVGLEVAADWRTLRSPETYLGDGRSSGFASRDRARVGASHEYEAAERLPLNAWDLTGTWTVAQHAAILDAPGGRIAFQFQARDVNLVMGPVARGASIRFRVFLDGQAVDVDHGSDTGADGRGAVRAQRTYQLIRQSAAIEERRFEIEFLDPGVEAYCFTFG